MAVIIDKKYKWRHVDAEGFEYWYIGSAGAVKKYISFYKNNSEATVDEIKNALLNLVGNFAFIIKKGKKVIAAVDKIRSYPLFYFHQKDKLTVSNSARALKNEYGLDKIDKKSFLEFQMAGFVTGRNTLYKDLYQIQAGEFITWNQDVKKQESARYYLFYSDEEREGREDDHIEELDRVTDQIFNRVIEDANDKAIWVPLSGGLDSRLVLCKLKKLGYENLHTFSYGPINNYEAKWAKIVADKVDVPWIFIPYTVKEIRDFFFSQTRKDYWLFSGEYCTLPFMVDEFAIHTLKTNKLIDDTSIFVNGQSGDFISGGHSYGYHLNALPDDSQIYDPDTIVNAIIKKHYSLNNLLLTKEKIQTIADKIYSILKLHRGMTLSGQQIAKYYEWWEWQERQSKYVVNGQRSYDFFGYKWALPLWADEYLLFWDKINYPFRFKQNLYKAYLDRMDFYGLFRKFKSVVWNWQGLSMLAIPAGAIIKRLLGINASKKFYHYAGYFGKYQNHYAPFGLKQWLINAGKLKNPIALYVNTSLKENRIN